jgi:hypothetical protein
VCNTYAEQNTVGVAIRSWPGVQGERSFLDTGKAPAGGAGFRVILFGLAADIISITVLSVR